MAATISIRLLGRGTSKLPMYCYIRAWENMENRKKDRKWIIKGPTIWKMFLERMIDNGTGFKGLEIQTSCLQLDDSYNRRTDKGSR